ncbi:MAG: sporulation protein YabP [Bacillota bacterium]|nr:sporulation protein YabP [Bacillota bacterium]
MVEPKDSHEVHLVNRKSMRITGVKDVESFDSEEFLLHTHQGYLAVRGKNLHMRNLNVEAGEVHIEGLVLDMMYMEQREMGEKAKGFFSRLFR